MPSLQHLNLYVPDYKLVDHPALVLRHLTRVGLGPLEPCVATEAILDKLDAGKVTSLQLNGSRSDNRDFCDLTFALPVLPKFTALQRLELENCEADNVANGLGRGCTTSSLRYVKLWSVRIADKHIPAVIEWLATAHKMQELCWIGSTLADLGATAIAHALPRWMAGGLEKLDLSYNQIGDDGATMLAIALAKGRNMYPLRVVLRKNAIKSSGANVLVRALGACSKVHLDLHGLRVPPHVDEQLFELAAKHNV
ncbi:hypothetical protein ACHHYP_15086 [Achlya hypogyna]|uniref:Uncharacterized protein n=1 Tax=Achlya hypogyna TaxID=1202772 RepID=A0A1V9YBI3_ACHHY|nr:hypothetical protein ACHHYP_15086 [Achlya hypogyna]